MSSAPRPASGIDWNQFDGVILDVDGTLFDHLAMRPAMARMFLRHLLTHRRGWRDLLVVLIFRRVRTQLALAEAGEIGRQDFEIAAQTARVSVAEAEEAVRQWIYQKPLSIIQQYAFSGADRFLALLKQRGLRTGVFSDYPAEDKLKALGLSVDVVRDATAKDIARLKPNPCGFLKVAELLGVSPSRCLIIGDRDDRDGAAAQRGGFAFLKKVSRMRPAQPHHFSSYHDLADELAKLRPAK
jgi:HAD superfamily hydrolase (TIGR01509 family)